VDCTHAWCGEPGSENASRASTPIVATVDMRMHADVRAIMGISGYRDEWDRASSDRIDSIARFSTLVDSRSSEARFPGSEPGAFGTCDMIAI
jgi:hypothetical protein